MATTNSGRRVLADGVRNLMVPFICPSSQVLSVFTTSILNPVLSCSCGSSCTKDYCRRPLKYDLHFISAGFQIPSFHKHLTVKHFSLEMLEI